MGLDARNHQYDQIHLSVKRQQALFWIARNPIAKAMNIKIRLYFRNKIASSNVIRFDKQPYTYH
jgi:hypothetical protein